MELSRSQFANGFPYSSHEKAVYLGNHFIQPAPRFVNALCCADVASGTWRSRCPDPLARTRTRASPASGRSQGLCSPRKQHRACAPHLRSGGTPAQPVAVLSSGMPRTRSCPQTSSHFSPGALDLSISAESRQSRGCSPASCQLGWGH